MNKIEIARDKFSSGCNCAQATLVALASDKLDMDTLEMLSSGFGGGIAQQGKTCGVVTGAIMALGLHKGYTQEGTDKKAELYLKAQKFLAEFEKRNGNSQCHQLIGYDMRNPEEKKRAVESGVFDTKCPLLVKSAVEIMDDIINK